MRIATFSVNTHRKRGMKREKKNLNPGSLHDVDGRMSVPVQFFMFLHVHYQDYTSIHDLYVAFKSRFIKSSSMNFTMTTLKFETGSDSPIKSCYTFMVDMLC